MKPIMFILALAVFAGFANAQLAGQSFAEIQFNDSVITAAELEAAETSVSDPGISPESPFYFIKRLGEKARLSLSGKEEKARLHLAYSRKRLAEAKLLIETNRTERAEKLIEEYDSEMDEFDKSGFASESEASKSRVVLMLVLEKSPEKARHGLQKALNNSIEKELRMRNSNISEKEMAAKRKIEVDKSKKLQQQVKDRVSGKIGKQKQAVTPVKANVIVNQSVKAAVNKPAPKQVNQTKIIGKAAVVNRTVSNQSNQAKVIVKSVQKPNNQALKPSPQKAVPKQVNQTKIAEKPVKKLPIRVALPPDADSVMP